MFVVIVISIYFWDILYWDENSIIKNRRFDIWGN